MELGHTLSIGAAWHLESLVIHNVSAGTSKKFICNAWFNAKDGRVKTWTAAGHAAGAQEGLRLVTANGQDGERPSVQVPYRLRVFTSNRLGAGTDAKVHVEFADQAGIR